jgi:hypothetical protein
MVQHILWGQLMLPAASMLKLSAQIPFKSDFFAAKQASKCGIESSNHGKPSLTAEISTKIIGKQRFVHKSIN